MTNIEPMIISSETRVTYSDPKVTHSQSRLMLEALEAPLADSRAAAVNIRLISCIGRQAKIGFCLQTRNSFNLLWLQSYHLAVNPAPSQQSRFYN